MTSFCDVTKIRYQNDVTKISILVASLGAF